MSLLSPASPPAGAFRSCESAPARGAVCSYKVHALEAIYSYESAPLAEQSILIISIKLSALHYNPNLMQEPHMRA